MNVDVGLIWTWWSWCFRCKQWTRGCREVGSRERVEQVAGIDAGGGGERVVVVGGGGVRVPHGFEESRRLEVLVMV
jgi:hypothetical protein